MSMRMNDDDLSTGMSNQKITFIHNSIGLERKKSNNLKQALLTVAEESTSTLKVWFCRVFTVRSIVIYRCLQWLLNTLRSLILKRKNWKLIFTLWCEIKVKIVLTSRKWHISPVFSKILELCHQNSYQKSTTTTGRIFSATLHISFLLYIMRG